MSDEVQTVLPHRRYNPLLGEWILCSPHRATRPWQGQKEAAGGPARPAYDPSCYLCPGNTRANGVVNPDYADTYVFENDFRALLDEEGLVTASDGDPLFQTDPVKGTCKVICFSPKHNETLAHMHRDSICRVIETWIKESAELARKYRWVQVFENKGSAMGCSNPHPHGQIWAMSSVPTLPAKEDEMQKSYLREHGKVLLLDYAQKELERGERVVASNDDWIVLVPFWATWPFETLLLPARKQVRRMTDLDSGMQRSLADILKKTALQIRQPV
jgi:UDPglucose--hexose-1-phosphate uridylyltransferase